MYSIQVEHPINEWIAEVNLPAAQVAVRMGIPLWLHFLVILISYCFLMYRSDASMEWTMDEATTSAGKLQLLLHHLSLMK